MAKKVTENDFKNADIVVAIISVENMDYDVHELLNLGVPISAVEEAIDKYKNDYHRKLEEYNKKLKTIIEVEGFKSIERSLLSIFDKLNTSFSVEDFSYFFTLFNQFKSAIPIDHIPSYNALMGVFTNMIAEKLKIKNN